MQAIDALKEVFTLSLLPDRKLHFLEEHMLSALPKGKLGKQYLLFWYFEDALKKR